MDKKFDFGEKSLKNARICVFLQLKNRLYNNWPSLIDEK